MIASRQIAFGKAARKKEEPPAYWGLCFTAEENGSVVAMEAVFAPTVTLETSFDGEIWEPFYVGETSITLNKGERVYFKAGEGGNIKMAGSLNSFNRFSLTTGRIAASGNIMSLLNGDIPDSEMTTFSFGQLFRYCTSLITPPELPANKTYNACYKSMFADCTSLITAPELPATVVAQECYHAMFARCTSLTTAPKLSKLGSRNSCYSMFNGCTNLNYIEVAFTKFGTQNNTSQWVKDVSPTGTFVCPTALGTNETITRGISACPEGWTVINKD